VLEGFRELTVPSSFLLGGLVALALAVCIGWVLQARLAAQVRNLPSFRFERELQAQGQRLEKLRQQLDRLCERMERLEEAACGAFQRLGLVRYSAFADTGSDQSFSLVLLDARDNGVVVTSLYGRNESRVYAKPLLDGKCPYRLSGEELAALARARDGKRWASLATGEGGGAEKS